MKHVTIKTEFASALQKIRRSGSTGPQSYTVTTGWSWVVIFPCGQRTCLSICHIPVLPTSHCHTLCFTPMTSESISLPEIRSSNLLPQSLSFSFEVYSVSGATYMRKFGDVGASISQSPWVPVRPQLGYAATSWEHESPSFCTLNTYGSHKECPIGSFLLPSNIEHACCLKFRQRGSKLVTSL